jgi:hypothetical protein
VSHVWKEDSYSQEVVEKEKANAIVTIEEALDREIKVVHSHRK